jgi:nitrogen fixation-related uncharacterized protein
MRAVILWGVVIVIASVWWSTRRFRFDDDPEPGEEIRQRMRERRELLKQREADSTASRMGNHW